MKIVWGLTIAFLFFAAIIYLKPIRASDENETIKQVALSPSLDLSGLTKTALIDTTLKRDPNKNKKKQD
ncbi:MAG: hypothetical protein KJN64_02880 [Ignavibacteria bacterium]|nr:hypothetical protein [Ignavibacteria bacterium]